MRTSSFRLVRLAPLAVAASLLGLISSVGATGHARSLQEIITRAEPAVTYLAVYDATDSLIGTGSGFVVGDNQVVTNDHVVERAERVEATFQDKRKVNVIGVSAFDRAADIALLKLPPGNYPKLVLADVPAKQGDQVVVIGSPMGFSGSVSTGIVAAFRPEGAELDGERSPNWKLQLTAAISPGSSGSPVLNENGDVVGVAVGVISGRGTALNFAVPASEVRTLYASRKKDPLPVSTAAGGRSRLKNLLISGGVLGGAAFAIWLVAWIVGRRRARDRDRGRAVLGSIFKR